MAAKKNERSLNFTGLVGVCIIVLWHLSTIVHSTVMQHCWGVCATKTYYKHVSVGKNQTNVYFSEAFD